MEIFIFSIICILVVASSSSPVTQFDEPSLEEALNSMENVQLEVDEEGQCVFVRSEEGTYSFVSPGNTKDRVCGLYLIAPPDREVEFHFKQFDISCAKGGLLSVIDGWELNGQFFPSPSDHPVPFEQRYTEMCGQAKPRKPFRTSQNVGLIEFRIPARRQGFTVQVRFRHNPKPCHVVLQEPQGTFTLRNYHRRNNCSVSVIFPLSVKLLATSIGVHFETGLLSKCHKRGIHDYVEIRGGDGLDPNMMSATLDFCGQQSTPSKDSIGVGCGHTAVRLVSSGRFENSVTFSFDLPEDFNNLDLLCPSLLSEITD